MVVSGTARPTTVDQLTPALEMYDGGCLPQLRERLGDHPHHRARVRILCAGHGVVHADTQMFADHHVMTGQRSAELRPYVREKLLTEFARDGVPREILVLAEPLYAQLVVPRRSLSGPVWSRSSSQRSCWSASRPLETAWRSTSPTDSTVTSSPSSAWPATKRSSPPAIHAHPSGSITGSSSSASASVA